MNPTCLSDVVDPCVLRAGHCPLPPRRDPIIPDWYSFQPDEDDDAYWTRIASQTKCAEGFRYLKRGTGHNDPPQHFSLFCLNAAHRIA